MSNVQNNTLFALPGADLAHIRRLAAADLEALRGSRLFLTGGTGFFGKWLLGALLDADATLGLGLEIAVLSRRAAKFERRYFPAGKPGAVRFVTGDVGSVSPDSGPFDFLIHAATDTTAFTTEAEEKERGRAIVQGTRNMLELARRGGVRRFLNVSSGAVYGAAAGKPGGAREEDYETAIPLIPYATAKREAEQVCADSGLDFSTARAFAFLGPHLPLDAHFAAGNFIRDALKGGPILVRGDGTALRSYLHPADLVIWLLRILVRGTTGRAYNVGSGEAVTTAELARFTAAAIEPAPEVIIQSVQANGPQNIYLPDVTRAKTELGLEVAIPLREAIARTMEWIQKQSQIAG